MNCKKANIELCYFCKKPSQQKCWIAFFEDVITLDISIGQKTIKQSLIELIEDFGSYKVAGYDDAGRVELFLKLAVKHSFPQYEKMLESFLLLR
jgi:hypothetical protein